MESAATYKAYALAISILCYIFCIFVAFVSSVSSTAAGVLKYLFLLIFGERENERTTDGMEEAEGESRLGLIQVVHSSLYFNTARRRHHIRPPEAVGARYSDVHACGAQSQNILKTPTDNDGRQVRGQQQPVVYAPLPSPPRPPVA